MEEEEECLRWAEAWQVCQVCQEQQNPSHSIKSLYLRLNLLAKVGLGVGWHKSDVNRGGKVRTTSMIASLSNFYIVKQTHTKTLLQLIVYRQTLKSLDLFI